MQRLAVNERFGLVFVKTGSKNSGTFSARQPLRCFLPSDEESVKQSSTMGARNQVGIGLSYRTASLSSLPSEFQTRFLELIPRPIAGLWTHLPEKVSPASAFLPVFGCVIPASLVTD